MTKLLISIDIGGTLGQTEAPSLATILASISPLGPRRAREIIRERLHTVPEVTEAVERDLCAALMIRTSAFPRRMTLPVLRLAPDAVRILRELSTLGRVITLSNVTCLEAGSDDFLRKLHPWVSDHFPSYRTGYSKPDPRAFLTAAACHDVPASRMVHIGDDWDCDVVGATGIGAAAIWISYGRPMPDRSVGWDGRPGVESSGVLVASDLAAVVPRVRSLVRRPA